ncbi:MAG: methyltransferase domain-containing protein, partial [Myxococcota bacterium]
ARHALSSDSMTSYYDRLADELAERYERLDFEQVHASLLDELPDYHARILDVGAGTGRDAAAIAARGHQVVAVEPSVEMRKRGRELHQDARIRWIDDSLPGLEKVENLGEKYDLILLSAVWMHVPPGQRERAMRKLASRLLPGGKLAISVRTVQQDRRDWYEVHPAELVKRARDQGLEFVRESRSSDLLERDEVAWTTLLFRMPDDGTSALPILRNIIVNDATYSTYKFGLLRTLLRIAAGAPGMVRGRDDGFVEVPTGLVCLYWLKGYQPLLDGGFEQIPGGRTTFGPALEELTRTISVHEWRIGSRFTGKRAQVLHTALKDTRKAITSSGPAKFITYADSNQPIFLAENQRTSNTRGQVELDRAYLWSFGTLKIPDQIWEAMSHHWVWIEPSVCDAWLDKMRRLDDGTHAYSDFVDALRWRGDDPRDTTLVADIIEQLAQANSPVAQGVWTGKSLRRRGDFEVDHCIPYSRWFNNSLWNLLPASVKANQSKGDKLPSMELMMTSRERITSWWDEAFVGNEEHETRFSDEAEASLPGLTLVPGSVDMDEVFDAVAWQIGRVRRDQQINEWAG